jgi:hypothetical protein
MFVVDVDVNAVGHSEVSFEIENNACPFRWLSACEHGCSSMELESATFGYLARALVSENSGSCLGPLAIRDMRRIVTASNALVHPSRAEAFRS